MACNCTGRCETENKKLKEENEKLKAENEQLTGISGQLKVLSVDNSLKLNKIICHRIKELEAQLERANRFHKDLTAENAQLKAQLQNYTELDLLNKFRLGDRVAVHREGRDKFRGTIFNIVNGKLSVIEDGFYSAHDDSPFLPSQCRKLFKRRKRDKVSQVEHCEHSGVELGKSKEKTGSKPKIDWEDTRRGIMMQWAEAERLVKAIMNYEEKCKPPNNCERCASGAWCAKCFSDLFKKHDD